MEQDVKTLALYYGVSEDVIRKCAEMTSTKTGDKSLKHIYECVIQTVGGGDLPEMNTDVQNEIFGWMDPESFVKVCRLNVKHAAKCKSVLYWIKYLSNRPSEDWLVVLKHIPVYGDSELYKKLMDAFNKKFVKIEIKRVYDRPGRGMPKGSVVRGVDDKGRAYTEWEITDTDFEPKLWEQLSIESIVNAAAASSVPINKMEKYLNTIQSINETDCDMDVMILVARLLRGETLDRGPGDYEKDVAAAIAVFITFYGNLVTIQDIENVLEKYITANGKHIESLNYLVYYGLFALTRLYSGFDYSTLRADTDVEDSTENDDNMIGLTDRMKLIWKYFKHISLAEDTEFASRLDDDLETSIDKTFGC